MRERKRGTWRGWLQSDAGHPWWRCGVGRAFRNDAGHPWWRRGVGRAFRNDAGHPWWRCGVGRAFRSDAGHRRWLRRGAVAAAVPLVAACAAFEEPPPAAPAPPPEEARVVVPVSTAAPGAAVDVEGSGFGANSVVQIGLGQPSSEMATIGQMQADAQGRVNTTLTLPSWVVRGQPYVVALTGPQQTPRAVSDAFVVGLPGDSVTVEGTLTNEGVECPAMRGRGNALYTLASSELQWGPGTDVRVRGTIAGASICMQGTTINVTAIERR